jgi:hypothetical protein
MMLSSRLMLVFTAVSACVCVPVAYAIPLFLCIQSRNM